MSTRPLGVLIIGLGNIGSRYDLALDPSKFVLTHARAFSLSPNFELLGGVDPSDANRSSFVDRYECRAWAKVEDALADVRPDVIVVAVPTPQHRTIVERVLAAAPPKAILCEKPIAYAVEDAEAILVGCEAAGTKLYVNYMRRADPAVRTVKQRIEVGEIASPVRGVAWYSKGILNSASHTVDLCRFWLGEMRGVRSLAAQPPEAGEDPNLPFVAEFGGSSVAFLPAEKERYFVNSIELMAGNGRLYYELSSDAIIWSGLRESNAYAGYFNLAPDPERIDTDLNRVQRHIVDELHLAIQGRANALCTGREALSILTHLSEPSLSW